MPKPITMVLSAVEDLPQFNCLLIQLGFLCFVGVERHNFSQCELLEVCQFYQRTFCLRCTHYSLPPDDTDSTQLMKI